MLNDQFSKSLFSVSRSVLPIHFSLLFLVFRWLQGREVDFRAKGFIQFVEVFDVTTVCEAAYPLVSVCYLKAWQWRQWWLMVKYQVGEGRGLQGLCMLIVPLFCCFVLGGTSAKTAHIILLTHPLKAAPWVGEHDGIAINPFPSVTVTAPPFPPMRE